MYLHRKGQIYSTVLFILLAYGANGFIPFLSQRSWPPCSASRFAEFKYQRPILHAAAPSFNSRFEKWRFLQDLLDGDVEDEVIGKLLLNVLVDFLNKHHAPTRDDMASGSPELTPVLRTKLKASIEELKQDAIAAMTDYSEAGAISKLDALLPDPIEEEDAYKSAWDTVMEIHGQDMVRANETNPTSEWRKLCLLARLLLHFDFLSKTEV